MTSSLHTLSEEHEPPYAKPARQEASFYELLRACQSPSDILDMAGKYTLTRRRVSNSLSRIWDTIKKMSDDQRCYEKRLIYEHPVFEHLCQKVMQDSQKMRNDDLAYSLLALLKLGVSQQSRVVQTLLRVAQEHLNSFDEKALSILANCLEEMESSMNVDALKSGVRLLVEIRIPEIKNVFALQSMMRCVGKDAPFSLKRKLEEKALSTMHQFSLTNSQHMFTTLAAMKFTSKPLLDICSQKISENMHRIPFWRLVYLLKSCRDLRYHNYTLFSSTGDYLASTFDMWNTKQVVTFLLLFEELGFCHVSLMDTFAQKVMDDSDSLTLKDVLNILKAYSLLNYVPQNHRQKFLESLTNVLETYLHKIIPGELLRAVFSFCLLGHFPQASLDKLLQKEVFDEILYQDPRFSGLNEHMLHYVNLCIQLDCPPISTTTTISPVRPPSLTFNVNSGLHGTLQSILGRGAFQQAVLLDNGYFIDFLITLDKDRKNICSLTQENDTTAHEDYQRVAVLCPSASSFCLGTTQPRGKLAMKMRHLEALDYYTVLVPEHEFAELPEEEKGEFMKKRIFAN
ncbi:FAKD2 protein, partial [Amia calva]|nr:FAKD2 protein [Amia calva]